MKVEEIMQRLKEKSSKDYIKTMRRYGITGKTLGVRIPDLRELSEEIGEDHELSRRLWNEECRETRLLASMIEEPEQVTSEQMNEWVNEFNSWETCDEVIMNCFENTEHAWSKINEWCNRDEEFVKRAGFVVLARLALTDEEAEDEEFLEYTSLIKEHAGDERNYVKKAVDWSIREVGKRNKHLNQEMIKLCKELRKEPSRNAKWIGVHALRELTSEKVQERFERKT